MNAVRKHAARIALFLECAGQHPVLQGSTYRELCEGLDRQYLSIEPELRWMARVEGRMRIRRAGGIEAVARRMIPVPASVCNLAKLSPDQRRRVQAAYRKKLRGHSSDTPPCSRCLIGAGMPKRSWPSRELAEQAKSQQHDPHLYVYPCPVQPGFWHLGHRRKRSDNPSSTTRPNSTDST